MSTRKSINKLQNSDSTISSSQDTPTLRSKQQNQDAGSESSEAPSTPTSKDSNQPNTAETKRKRRTNSTQSISTPKRSTSEVTELSTNESDKIMIKDIKEEKSTTPPQSDSPRTRKKTVVKSNTTIAKRKSAAAEAILKNPPLRSSLRAKNNSLTAKKNTSPNDSFGTPKGGSRTRKKAEAIFTPIKRERINSDQSENELDDEVPDTKRIKIEKIEDEEPEEEILMEIRTEILDEIRAKDEVKMIEIKDEKPDSELDVNEAKFESVTEDKSQECMVTPEKPEKKSSNNDSKDDILILDTPEKVIAVIDDEEDGDYSKKRERDSSKKKNVDDDKEQNDANEEPSDDNKNKDADKKKKDLKVESGTKRPRRKAAVIATSQSKRGGKGKKEALPTQPARRGRTPRAAATAALTRKTPYSARKVTKATDITNTKPSNKSPVPECTEESDTTKTQVPESLEDDDISNSEPTGLIFSTTTEPVNSDKFDQPHEPLMIDTSTQNSDGKDSIPSTECTAGSEKSASLSPVELESEGVSAVCVKRFYKEPQFLENNLGIEMDPKLGGIVQTVDKEPKQDTGVSTTIVSTMVEEKCSQSGNRTIDLNTSLKDERIAGNDIDDKIVCIAESMVPDELGSRNSKLPGHVEEVNDESDLSDSIKEGELLLVLEESTEEENTLSQKTNDAESKLETSNASERMEIGLSTKLNDAAIQERDPKLENKVENEIRTEVEKKITLPEQIIEENPEEELKQILNSPKHVSACASEEAFTKDEDITTEYKAKIENDNDQILGNNATAEDMQIAEDYDTEKDVIENESTAMEIDSGVSDVAENNSNDPNEDLNSITELIGCDNQKEEISDSENTVNTVIPSVSVNKKVNVTKVKDKTKSLMKPAKLLTPKDEKKDIPHIIKVNETPETIKQKENHLKSLGLLTIKAADEAKIEKQKRRQQLNVSTPSTSKNVNGNASNVSDSSSPPSCNSSGSESNAGNGNGNGSASGSNESGNKTVQEYTGTLKTVIKLNRPTATPIQSSDKKKTNGSSNGQSSLSANSMALVPVPSSNASGRMPLKITLQKGRGRGPHMERHANGTQNSNEDTYYTIQNESEAGVQETVTHGRKSHHYRSNIDQSVAVEAVATDKKEVLIPEKASSFAIHPGRLCQDQCFYCGGKFGLYDTPCHVAQLKNSERQKRILENEEKLTVDNCLCDACFRHLDRRANAAAAAQKKRLSAPSNNESQSGENADGYGNESTEGGNDTLPIQSGHTTAKPLCFVTNCGQHASHSFRRKGFRKTIKKLLGDDIDLTNMTGRLPICDKHYEIIIQCLECALCKRRLIRNHMHHITQDVQLLESLLVKQGIPVKLQANPAVCKLCRYFTNLLLKPPEGKTQKAQFVKNYRKRLLHFHNVQQSDEGSEAEEQDETAEKPKSQLPAPAKRGRKPKKPQPATLNQSQSTSATSEDGSSNEIVDLDADTTPQPTTAGSGQMQLDNDVMVDYDLPVICDTPSPPAEPKQSQPQPQPQHSKLQAILQGSGIARNNDDISLALRSNPNISMRELFPGEEDLGLQVNVPFGSSTSHRTPEGWTRVQTFLQYDEPTRRLWEDLQKPYGNQSSFLRHLILLEKYFRNGDLILSQNASTNAVAYSETVQNRLHSYDYCVPSSSTTTNKNITAPSTGSSSSTRSISQQQHHQQQQHQQQQKIQINSSLKTSNSASANGNIGNNKIAGNIPRNTGMLSVPDPIKKLHSNLTITITPKTKLIAETTQASTPSTGTSASTTVASLSGSSILKSNLLNRKNSAIEIIPISAGPNSTDTSTRPVMTSLTKQQKILAAANQLMGEEKTSNSANTPMTSMAITHAQNHQPKHLNFPPELISINRSNSNSLLIGNRNVIGNNSSLKSKPHSNMHPQPHSQQSSSHRPLRLSPTVIKLPATLSPHERMTSKHWRPTLMPMNSGPLRSAPGVLYQTADGRRLPSLVQVQSGGKPYLISIHDYNRMCILRRDKLMRDQMIKNGKVSGSGTSSGGHSLLKGALSSNSGINISTTNSPSISNVVSLSNSTTKTTILSQGGKQW